MNESRGKRHLKVRNRLCRRTASNQSQLIQLPLKLGKGKGFFIKKNEAVFNGRISDIWRAKKKDSNEELCVKVVRLKAAPKHYLQMYSRRNLKVLQALNHASIVKVHKIFALQSNDKVFIFMDYG